MNDTAAGACPAANPQVLDHRILVSAVCTACLVIRLAHNADRFDCSGSRPTDVQADYLSCKYRAYHTWSSSLYIEQRMCMSQQMSVFRFQSYAPLLSRTPKKMSFYHSVYTCSGSVHPMCMSRTTTPRSYSCAQERQLSSCRSYHILSMYRSRSPPQYMLLRRCYSLCSYARANCQKHSCLSKPHIWCNGRNSTPATCRWRSIQGRRSNYD